MSDLCPSCQAESSSWLDYHLPPALGIAYGSGAPYDISPAGIRDRQRARFAEWRDTIRFNRALIAETCRKAGHTVTVAAVIPARFVEVPLFDFGEAA